MAISVVMPALELTQETGKLVSWRKKDGERVNKGEPLVEIETDKAVVEVEATADGVLAGILAAEGDIIPVGQVIAWIVAPGESLPVDAAPDKFAAKSATGAAANSPGRDGSAQSPSLISERSSGDGSAKISPKARRLAREHNVDLSRVRGSGPDGEILASDIEASAKSQPQGVTVSTQAEPVSRETAKNIEVSSSIARLMAERTSQSWTTVPHFFVARDMDAGAMARAREKLGPAAEKLSGVKITYTDLLVALVARTMPKHPRVNASWSAEGIRLHSEVNVAVAIAVKDGVTAAVIRNAHTASLAEIATQRRDLAEHAKAGKSRPQDLSGGTFTISNLGMYNVDSFIAIITPPQAAILAVGRIAERAVAVEGKATVRPIMTLTLSCDHRVIDGAHAAAFLNDLAEAISNPEDHIS